MHRQPVETRIRHQHIAAAAQHKQRHVPLARPQRTPRQSPLRWWPQQTTAPGPQSRGSSAEPAQCSPESSKIKTTAMHEIRNRPSNHGVYCYRIPGSLIMRTQVVRVFLPVFCLAFHFSLVGQAAGTSTATTSANRHHARPDPDSGMTGHRRRPLHPARHRPALPRQNRRSDPSPTARRHHR